MTKSKKYIVIISLVLALFLLPLGGILTGCTKKEKDTKEVRIGASSTPHAEILKEAKKAFEDKGYKLTIEEIDSYDTMNDLVKNDDLDANYFQHTPWLNGWEAGDGNKDKLETLVKMHYEPMGIYRAKATSLPVTSGTITIPNADNQQRALELLEDAGVISYKGEGDKAEVASYDAKGKTIKPVDATIVGDALPESELVVFNGDKALAYYKAQGKKVADERLYTEGQDYTAEQKAEYAEKYANLVAVRKNDDKWGKDSDIMKALVEVLTSQAIKDFIANTYEGAVLSV